MLKNEKRKKKRSGGIFSTKKMCVLIIRELVKINRDCNRKHDTYLVHSLFK